MFTAIAVAIGAAGMYVLKPAQSTVALDVDEEIAATSTTEMAEPDTQLPTVVAVSDGALERPPAVESRLELDINVYDPPEPELGDVPISSTTTEVDRLDVTALDLTWKPGEFIQKVCVATLFGVSRLCVVTTVGVSVDGQEDMVYEASETSPMMIGTQLLVDNPSAGCQDVASCVALVAMDTDACTRFLESIDWLSWQLGTHSAYNNGIPGLEEYPRSWVNPVYFDAAGSNLRVDIGSDCSASATQL